MSVKMRPPALSLEGRRVPPLGAFNLTFLGLEIRRLLRNRRTVTLSIVVPVIFFFLFKSQAAGALAASTMIGPVLGALAFVGGLFVPLTLLPPSIQTVGPYTPTYGVAQIARSPLLGGGIDPTWLLNVALWTAAFSVGAIILFRRDTQRT